MNRRALLALAAALPFAGAARAQTAAGRLILHEAVTSAHVKARNVSVWLPPGYEASDAAYPVLYMHDGQNLFDPSTANFGEWGVDEHLTRLIAALAEDMRGDVQAVYGGPPLSDGYIRFLTEELKPFVDRTYRTLPGREDTLISGSSMGGLISLYAVMKRPEVFSAAACLSTHWPLRVTGLDGPGLEAWRERLVAAWTGVIERGLPAPGANRFYFDRGDETLDQFYAAFQTQVDAVFRRRGYGPGDFQSLVFPGAQHNEASWNQRLDVPLSFLLSPAPTRNP